MRTLARWCGAGAALLAVLMALCLSGCSGPCTRWTLQDLRMPGVRKVFDGASLPVGPMGAVFFIHPYVGPAPWDADRRARALVRLGTEFYIFDITQGSMRQIAPDRLAVCGPYPDADVTPNGQWLTCSTPPDDCSGKQNGIGRCVGQSIQLVPLAPGGVPREVVPHTPGVQFWGAAWSPDGLHLATSRWQTGDYNLLIFTSATPYGAAQLSAVMPLANEQGAGVVSWSDDGAYLAYTSLDSYGRSGEVGVLSIAALPAAALTRGHDVVTVTVTDASVRTISAGDTILRWRPGKHVLTVHDNSRVVQIDVSTDAVTTALALPSGAAPLEAAAWLADGSGLLFAVGYPGNVECSGTHPDFYLFTPS